MKFTPKSHLKRLARQAGFTIVELSVAVAIAGILLVGAISLVQTVLQTSRANDTIGGLARVFAQIEKLYNSSQSYSGINSAAMIGMGVFQGPFNIIGVVPNQKVNNRFGYPVDVLPINDYPGKGDARAYAVMFRGVPQKVCGDIVTASDAAGVKAISIGAETAGAGVAVPAYDNKIQALTGFLTTNVADNIVKGTDNNGQLSAARLTGSTPGAAPAETGCNQKSDTVAIALINWK